MKKKAKAVKKTWMPCRLTLRVVPFPLAVARDSGLDYTINTGSAITSPIVLPRVRKTVP